MNLASIIANDIKARVIMDFLNSPESVEAFSNRIIYNYRLGDSTLLILSIPGYIADKYEPEEELNLLLFDDNVDRIELLLGDYGQFNQGLHSSRRTILILS